MCSEISIKYCHACGKQIDHRAELCPMCGVRQAGFSLSTPGGKNRIAAALFALFLGGLGIHKFYLGKIGMGILYLIFFWSIVPAVIGVIEGIILLTMSDQDFAAKYK